MNDTPDTKGLKYLRENYICCKRYLDAVNHDSGEMSFINY